MFTVTENARKELEAFFADKPKSTIRIYLAPGGCSGPRLGLALDDAGEDDAVLESEGYTFCLSKQLHEQIGGVAIDVSYMGFTVTPENPLPDTGSSSSCCSSCGSGCSTGCGGGCH